MLIPKRFAFDVQRRCEHEPICVGRGTAPPTRRALASVFSMIVWSPQLVRNFRQRGLTPSRQVKRVRNRTRTIPANVGPSRVLDALGGSEVSVGWAGT